MKRVDKFKPTTPAERMRFVWMWRAGFSARAISLKCGTTITTVCRWIRRWINEGHVNSRFREGKPHHHYSDTVQNESSLVMSPSTQTSFNGTYQVCNHLYIQGKECYCCSYNHTNNVGLFQLNH